MSAAGENFSVSGRYYAVSQPSQSQSVQKNLACGGLFSLMGTPFGQKVAYGNCFGNPPPAPGGGASKELSEGDSGTRKPMFHIFAFPDALWVDAR